MGIKFYCPNGHKLNVKSFLAGKKGVCPDCGVSLVIPMESQRKSKKDERDTSDDSDENPGARPDPAVATAHPQGGSPAPMMAILPSPTANLTAPPNSVAAGLPTPTMPVVGLTGAAMHVPVMSAPVAAGTASVAAASQLSSPTMLGVPVPTTMPMPSPVPIVAAHPVVSYTPQMMGVAPQPMAVGVQPVLPVAPASATIDPLDEAPNANWYVRPPSGGQYGPARADVFRKWMAEGRVSNDSLVWRDGWPDWLDASKVFPSLQIGAAASLPGVPTPTRRTVHRKSKASPTFAITVVVTLGLLAVGLLVALIVVIQSNAAR